MKKGNQIMMVLAICLAVLLTVGCGNSGQGNQKQASSEKREQVIGMSLPAADHGWTGAIAKNAEDEAKALGVKYKILAADNPNKQVSDIESLIAQKVSVIIMNPVDSAALTPIAKKVKEANIPLIIFDREIESGDYTLLIKGDNKGVGINAAKYIAEKLGGKGNVVDIQGVPCSVTTLRTEGFEETIKASYSGINIVASQPGDFQKEKAYSVAQNILQAQPKIDAIYTQDDEMALGVLKAIQEAKRTDIKVLTGTGGNKEYYEVIKGQKGIEVATFLYSPLMVKDCVKAAAEILKGNMPKQKDIIIPADTVTKDNVAKFYNENANY
ncbi:substrate-binding domain-containing protein [Pelosinus sp. UFO1]|uniref:substrate-binding domain-containing protein n=1 Tax=Pelosinus sp. UFO1 TaxID=484770 RepID=UPI0004D1C318|nr:substrate-binding domain-containing protein [Pelosinus sp. UFO1]AIF53003.1 Periplasmic binding protein domain containing protein [Pelosinus sp. UFO1]